MTWLHRLRWRFSDRYRRRVIQDALYELEQADLVDASVGLDGERRYRPTA